RYTEQARRVIFFARYEASQSGSEAIEPEHLLLGISREDGRLLARLLPNGSGSVKLMRSRIECHVAQRERIPTSVELPLAPETKRTLHYAHEESDRLQNRHIGTEHLLLGLLREERSIAARVLVELGVGLERLRERIKQDGNIRSLHVDPATRSMRD